MNQPIIYIMGVSGSGKSTIAALLSDETGIPFFDGDDYHPKENIQKMSEGQALNDSDRKGWLETLNTLAKEQALKSGAIIVSSALKESYREILSDGINTVHWVFLRGNFETISERLKKRTHKYMPSSLLQSQFDALEVPAYGVHVNIDQEPSKIIQKIKKTIMSTSEFGLYGLGVMGKSLSRNLARKGFSLSLYNRHVAGSEEKVAEQFVAEFQELSNSQGFDNVASFVRSLQAPRKIFLMVQAGKVTDTVIKELLPHLEKGDIIIDGGNSHYKETEKRISALLESGIHFIGCGVSGGEEGALNGPSIMPGGDADAYKQISPYLEAIAARDAKGDACCAYVGKGGAGHFVKMIHNGIEYAEMQLLAELYQFMRFAMGYNPDEIAGILESWVDGDLNSYLLEITIDILRTKGSEAWLIDEILDKAGNKGTGSWSTTAAAELGVPATMITAALFARYLSSFKEERKIASYMYEPKVPVPIDFSLDNLAKAYQTARVVNHHQGIHLINTASRTYGWRLNLPELARIWTNGCIIRSDLMQRLIPILQVTDRILFDERVQPSIAMSRPSLENFTIESIKAGLNSPCFTAALNFLNGFTNVQSSANIIQAQRDYFGAHTYKRVDDPDGESHHTIWKK